MTQHRLVTLRLPIDLIARIEALARASEQTPAETIRQSLATALRDSDAPMPRGEMQVISAAFERAQGWLDLQARLRKAGFVLRLDGDGLNLHEWPSDRFVVRAEDLGHSLTELTLQYRAPFPGALVLRAGFRSGRERGRDNGQAA